MPRGIYKRIKPIWNKGKKHSLEQIEKLRVAAMGRKHTLETIEKLSISHLGIRNGMYGKTREFSPNWKGGISFEPYSPEWKKSLKMKIKERDNHTCQLCFSENNLLHVHHIDYDKKNCSESNLISLCVSCHGKTNFNRKYWKNMISLKV